MLFGEVVSDTIHLSEIGRIVHDAWEETPSIRAGVGLGAWIVMPNHLHGVLIIEGDAQRQTTPDARLRHANRSMPTPHPRGPESGSLGAIIGQFKSVTTKRMNRLRETPGAPVWQRNYYDRIIRDEREYERIHDYIEANPLNWHKDKQNPARGQ